MYSATTSGEICRLVKPEIVILIGNSEGDVGVLSSRGLREPTHSTDRMHTEGVQLRRIQVEPER